MDLDPRRHAGNTATDAEVLSPGEAECKVTELRRPSLRAASLAPDRMLDRLVTDLVRTLLAADAEGAVIICAPHPYAALSELIDHVSGFLFMNGGMLCHLAMLQTPSLMG